VPQKFTGRLDRIDEAVLEGWALHPEDEEECQVLDVLIDGVFVGQVKAGLYREDLAKANLRAGYAKFLYYIPSCFIDGRTHSIDMRHAGTAHSIDNMPTSFTIGVKASVQLAERRNWALQTLVLKDETLDDGFAAAVRAVKRVAFVSTFHNANSFLLYQRSLFSSLADAGFVVVIVHASTLYDERLDTTTGPGCYTIVKRNVGYDFGSWAVGAFTLDALLGDIDEVLLVNDSVLELEAGVLANLIARALNTGADAVGVTESYEQQYHLQSYFIWLGPNICRSSLLRDFMAGLSFSSDKTTVIKEGELALTARIAHAGFRIACLTPYQQVAQRWLDSLDRIVAEIRALPSVPSPTGADAYKGGLLERLDQIVALVMDGTPVNPGHFFWDALIEGCDCRLLKRELVILNPCRVPTHYRLGSLLAARPAARSAILDLRQRYGGALIPTFWTGADREPPPLTRRKAGQLGASVAPVTLTQSKRTAPAAIAWNNPAPAKPALATDWPDNS
jgi:rhamnosyltransferase